jgi:hypothetical protein
MYSGMRIQSQMKEEEEEEEEEVTAVAIRLWSEISTMLIEENALHRATVLTQYVFVFSLNVSCGLVCVAMFCCCVLTVSFSAVGVARRFATFKNVCLALEEYDRYVLRTVRFFSHQ